MGFSVHGSYRQLGQNGDVLKEQKYPHNLTGRSRFDIHSTGPDGLYDFKTSRHVNGLDPAAMKAVRDTFDPATKAFHITPAAVVTILKTLQDTKNTVTAWEIPIFDAIKMAAQGKHVQMTDAHGAWRDIQIDRAAATLFLRAASKMKVERA
jgi:hypothetical protein